MLLCLRDPHSQIMGGRMSSLYWPSKAPIDRLRPYFRKIRGRADNPHVLCRTIFINHDGLSWCDALLEYGPLKTLYNHWKRGNNLGEFARIMMGLAEQTSDNKTILIDATHLKLYCKASSLGLK